MESESEQEYSSSSDEDFSPPTNRPTSITLEFPSKSLTKATGQVADSQNMSIRDHLAMQASAGGGDINQISLSVSTVLRPRRENRKELQGKLDKASFRHSSLGLETYQV